MTNTYSMEKKLHKTNILIIGSGLSGLTSALRINEREPSLSVSIVEASNKIGGQMHSTHLGEIGAKWITEDQYHIYQLLQYLGVSLRKRNMGSPHLKRCWQIDEGLFASLSKYELNRYLKKIDLDIEIFKPGEKIYRSSKNISMYNHIHKSLFFASSRKFMENLVLLISGTRSQDISYDNFVGISYTYGSIQRIIDLLYIVPNTILEFSTKDLIRKILNRLQYTEIIYGHKITEISQYRDQVNVKDSANNNYTADVVILAIPWNNVQDIRFSPPLPMELQKPPPSLDITRYVLTSFLAKYREAHWRAKGYSGQYLSLEPFMVAQENRNSIIFGQLIHEEGIEPLVRSLILHKLSEKYGEDMLIPLEFCEHTYDLNLLNHTPLTTAWNRVIWSSSAAAGTYYRGQLNGAVQSGYRAALNALLVTRPQVVRWQDISEIQCHKSLPTKDVTFVSRCFSSWNLYNVSMYTGVICGLVLMLSRVYKKHN